MTESIRDKIAARRPGMSVPEGRADAFYVGMLHQIWRADFDEDQPRDEGGKWTSGGFSGGGKTLEPRGQNAAKKEKSSHRAARAAFHAKQAIDNFKKASSAKTEADKKKWLTKANNSLKKAATHVKAADKFAKSEDDKKLASLAKQAHETASKFMAGKSVASVDKDAPASKPSAKMTAKMAKLEEKAAKVQAAKEKAAAAEAKWQAVKKSNEEYAAKQAEAEKQAKAKAAAEKPQSPSSPAPAPVSASTPVAPKPDAAFAELEAKHNAPQVPEKVAGRLHPQNDRTFGEIAANAKIVHLDKFHADKASYASKLHSSEKDAVLTYSGSAYKEINSGLRQDKLKSKLNDTVKNIDTALDKSPADSDMVVFRGMSGAHFFEGKGPGDSYVDKGYMSTTVKPSSSFGGDVEMHIVVPKGHPAAPIPSHFDHEKEILLPRNQRIHILSIEKVGGKTRVRATVSKA